VPTLIPPELQELADRQRGVVSRKQAIESGLPPGTIDRLVRTRRWVILQRGIYSLDTGRPSRGAALWAVLLRAGPGAVLSHQTAAELHRLYDEESVFIHVTVSQERHIRPIQGAIIHRSVHLAITAQQNLLPPRTRIEDTVLDLTEQASTFDRALAVASAACQRRLTTAAKLLAAMAGRGKLRWRAELADALADIGSGAHSLLEYRYVRRVERPHGLPAGIRQAKIVAGGRNRYLDNLYEDFALCVELDGRQTHPDDLRWDDVRRDNAVAAGGLVTLRYGWDDVTARPCATAAEIAAALRRKGWSGRVRPCGPDCAAAAPAGHPGRPDVLNRGAGQ